VPEVLSVEPDDEGRNEQHRSDHGQPLHHLVLLVRDLRLVVIARAREQVARKVEPVHRSQQLVVDVREVELDLAREQLSAFTDVDAPVDDPPDRVARGRDGAANVEKVVPQPRDALPDLVRAPDLDPVLELVDLLVDRVHQIEEVFGDLIDQPIDDHPDALVLLPRDGVLHALDIERVPLVRCLAHGDQTLARRDQVDLLVEDFVLLADADRHQEDAVDVVVVAFETRSRLVIVKRRPEQLLERELVDVARQRVVKLLSRRVEQVDPFGHPAETRPGFG